VTNTTIKQHIIQENKTTSKQQDFFCDQDQGQSQGELLTCNRV